MSELPAETLRAEILDWRDAARRRVRQRLAELLPGLRERLAGKIADMTVTDLLRPGRFHDREIAPLVEAWMLEQLRKLGAEVQLSLDDSLADVEGGSFTHGWTTEEIVGLAAAGVATVSPVAAIPVATMAVTTGSVLFVFTTSTVSIPILAGVVLLAAGLGATGYLARSRIVGQRRDRYRTEVLKAIEARILGGPGSLDSLADRLAGAIDAIARTRTAALEPVA